MTSPKSIRTLNLIATICLAVCILMVFFYAPIERTMGNVQRILYFHVGSGWTAAIAYFIALIGGILYLRRPHKKWDTLSLASVEIGLVFTTMNIVSGSIWGYPAWNTWWIWSPRLTSITVMWLVYVAYFMLRGAVDDEGKRGRFAGVYVIAGFVTVIFTYLSIRFLRDIHPVVVGTASEIAEGGSEFGSGIESARMGITLAFSTFTFTMIYIAWLANRMRLQNILDQTARLRVRVLTRLQQ